MSEIPTRTAPVSGSPEEWNAIWQNLNQHTTLSHRSKTRTIILTFRSLLGDEHENCGKNESTGSQDVGGTLSIARYPEPVWQDYAAVEASEAIKRNRLCVA